ncbi:histidine kinase [Heyndrickxia shackletonii]|uniref:histidine kinase n=1 Tax=Heyndrickxia shackletonii TaxID=157838 RepID=A0A0Q3WVA2_9BACI|nr:ATP-binding protein [Heyndrickxia shackletonii]KQL52427.1 histidine kinase [Heyndrickxia shackletonii]NEY99010.1 HAMP domain-containing protein [Heyndrickxia shackletonii]
MKNRFLARIQLRILTLIALSALLSAAVTFGLLFLAYILRATHFLSYSVLLKLYYLNNFLGLHKILYMVCGILFLIFILVLSRKWAKNFDQILDGTSKISQGDFQFHVPVYSKNELGDIAQNLNSISSQLQKSIKEERKAVQAKNELITNVSHDLRTPLTSIMGYLRLIEEDRYNDEVELRYYVSIAFDKAIRLDRMVSDLFEYTRVNFGTIQLEYARIDLVQLLSQVSAQFLPQLEERQMEIQLKSEFESIFIEADGDKLVRVFENLISNGLKYGKEGKCIDIRVGKEEKMVVAEVVNYGNPIPEEDLPFIFERFYRVEKSRSIDTGGSGLGLAITKSIVELHNGTIEATSNKNETNFKIMLPMERLPNSR